MCFSKFKSGVTFTNADHSVHQFWDKSKDFVHETNMPLSMAWLMGWGSSLDYATAFDASFGH
jgi:hypothetical protein